MTRVGDLGLAYDDARPRLLRVAYAVLGSMADAEDVVADCWLRLVGADAREPVVDVVGWSVVAVARRALDVLRSARVRREAYVGPWLPEPLVDLHAGAADPADLVTLDESVGFALLVVLESLSPAERTAWVLHDLFGLPFTEIADVVGRSPAALRQLASRARVHVAERAPRYPVDPVAHAAVVDAFLGAAAGGDLDGLLAVLDPDVVLVSDGGGEVRAARRPVLGADHVARFVLGIAADGLADATVLRVPVNGLPGLVVVEDHGTSLVCSLTTTNGRVTRVDLVRAPGKLRGVRLR